MQCSRCSWTALRRRRLSRPRRGEVPRVRAAGRRDGAADVLLQVGLPEPLAGPHGQGRDAVRGQPDIGATAAGALPSTSSCQRTARQQAGRCAKAPATRRPRPGLPSPLPGRATAGQTHLLLGHAVLEVLAEIADNGGAAAGPQPVVGRVAHRRQQVRPEGEARPAATDRAEYPGEGLGDDIVATSRGAIDRATRRAAGACSTYSSS